MSEEEFPCVGICQTDEFGYCLGCGRRAEPFPDPPEQAGPGVAAAKVPGREEEPASAGKDA